MTGSSSAAAAAVASTPGNEAASTSASDPPPSAPVAANPTAKALPPKPFWLRRTILMIVLPAIAVAAGLNAWVHAGRLVATENAYVKSHVVNIAPEVSGAIQSVLVEEHQHVKAGTTLYQLRDDSFRIAVSRAEAALAQAGIQIAADQQAYHRALAQIDELQTSVDYAKTQHARQASLRQRNLGSAEDLDTAAYALASAEQQIAVAKQEAATLLARLAGDVDAPVEWYPAYQAALAERSQALLDLERTAIKAPFDGVVINRPEPGDYAERGITTMALVADSNMWIEANFKETQLTYLREGQSATVSIDTYPGQVWRGSVHSVSEATGAEFALLPPQNATGNWVKIVQRVPVRIALEQSQDAPPLRAGMSSEVTVDTGHARAWRDLLPN